MPDENKEIEPKKVVDDKTEKGKSATTSSGSVAEPSPEPKVKRGYEIDEESYIDYLIWKRDQKLAEEAAKKAAENKAGKEKDNGQEAKKSGSGSGPKTGTSDDDGIFGF